METVFKVGDKVFHYKQGWGIVTDYTQCLMRVEFTKSAQFLEKDDKLLSFTEYTLQGFTQERPIVLPEVGELCLVKNNGYVRWIAVNFKMQDENRKPHQFIDSTNAGWEQLKRIKILD